MAVLTRLFPTIFLCFLCLSCSDSGSPPQGEMPKVGVFQVFEKKLRLQQTFPGRVIAYNTAEIRPQVGGIILKRTFEEGSLVKEGDILYEIDPAPYQAVFDKALAREKNLENLAQRRKTLMVNKAVSRQEYEDAYYDWQQAKAELDTARLNLRYCTVKAPLSGKIGKSDITMGALVVADQPFPMATIHQIDPVHVDIYPAVAQVSKLLDKGDKALESVVAGLVPDGSKAYPLLGRIQFIDNHVKEGSNTLGIRLVFDNPKGVLVPGMFARATLMDKESQPYTLVPQQAVFRDAQGQTQVWVVKDDHMVELRSVIVGESLGNVWIVLDGLTPGENVVTEGHLRVREGAPVDQHSAQNIELLFDFSDEGLGEAFQQP